MRTCSYNLYSPSYGKGLLQGNVKDESRPLVVNCAGSYSMDTGFRTVNSIGRVDHYLLFVVDGVINIDFPDGSKKCENGTFIVIPPNTPYSYSTDAGKSFSYLWLHFSGSEAAKKYTEYGIKAFPSINRISDNSKVVSRFNGIFNILTRNDDFFREELSIMLERLFITLGRGLLKRNEKMLRLSLGYISANYNSQIRIPELARLESLSVSRYNTLFKRSLGVSPVDYITNLRINAACELIASTDKSIKEIAATVGYDDSHFFSKIFKKRTGLSPTEYRKDPEGYVDILQNKP